MDTDTTVRGQLATVTVNRTESDLVVAGMRHLMKLAEERREHELYFMAEGLARKFDEASRKLEPEGLE
jgi:hypothetical protein